eukprot:4416218-Prymnesium_polylepis.1
MRKPSTKASMETATKSDTGNGGGSGAVRERFITVTLPGVPAAGLSCAPRKASPRLLPRFLSSSSSSSSLSAEQNLPMTRNRAMPNAKPSVMPSVVATSFGAALMMGTARRGAGRSEVDGDKHGLPSARAIGRGVLCARAAAHAARRRRPKARSRRRGAAARRQSCSEPRS